MRLSQEAGNQTLKRKQVRDTDYQSFDRLPCDESLDGFGFRVDLFESHFDLAARIYPGVRVNYPSVSGVVGREQCVVRPRDACEVLDPLESLRGQVVLDFLEVQPSPTALEPVT